MAKAKLIKKGTKKVVKPTKKTKPTESLQQAVQRIVAQRSTAQSQGRIAWSKLWKG